MKGYRIRNTLLCVLVICILMGGVFAYCWNHTDIPKLYLEGDISQMTDKKDERSIRFCYQDGNAEYEGFASIKVQGTSSLSYDKKNYTLKFYSDEAHEDKLNMDVGWGPRNKYCVKANWIDRTHARNVVSARLAGQMQDRYGLLQDAPNNGAVDGFPVEIYSNGKFLGLYTFNIPKDEWQFEMDGDNPDHIVIGGEGWEPANLFLAKPDFGTWAVEVGEASEQTLAKMDRLFDFVVNSDDETFKRDFSRYLNLDSALNYYVFADLAYLKDNLGKNMLLATYDGEIWYLSLYDLDSSWGVDTNGYRLMPYEDGLLDMAKNNLFARMEANFPELLAQRYFDLRGSVLSTENILKAFYAFEEEIPQLTFVKESIRWGSGLIRRQEDLPGYGYGQLEAYLESVTGRLDARYSAMLEK